MAEQHAFVRAYIGLGSNLADPESQLKRAVEALGRIPQSRLAALSRFYRSRPMGPADQPDYINAVAMLDTRLDALDLLDALQAIELEQGRVRGPQRWGPRTLDLDLLLYGAEIINNERLLVPHPGIADRNFVLYPLADIAPELVMPDGTSLQQMLADCSAEGLAVIEQEKDVR